jgi:hypothetical protein
MTDSHLHGPPRLYKMVDCRVQLFALDQMVAPLLLQADHLGGHIVARQLHRLGVHLTYGILKVMINLTLSNIVI